VSDEWVSWFINGEARHFPADSVTGREIIAKLEELEQPAGYCRAPKSLFRNQICGKALARKGQTFCSSACRTRAHRAEQADSPQAALSPGCNG